MGTQIRVPLRPCPWWRARPHIWGLPYSQLCLVFDQPQIQQLLPGCEAKSLCIQPAWGPIMQRLEEARRDNSQWLAPWEATLPRNSRETLPTVDQFRRRMQKQMRDSQSLVMAIVADGQVCGSVSFGNVQHGAMSLGNLGYWISEQWSRQGITSLAVAAVCDLLIGELGMHRIEINVRPENQASLGLCNKLRFRHEGTRQRYMCINGHWADHVSFVVDQEMLLHGGLVASSFPSKN